MITNTLLFPILFLAGSCLLMAIKTAINRLTTNELETEFEKSQIRFFLFKWIEKIFPNERTYPVNDFLSLTGLINVVAYGISGSIYFTSNYAKMDASSGYSFLWLLLSIGILVAVALIVYVIFHLFASRSVVATFKLFSLLASLYIVILLPIVLPIVWIEKKIAPDLKPKEPPLSSQKLKRRLLELLDEDEIEQILDPRDKHLLKSIANFGELVVREIMVPRVNVVCLPETATLSEALEMFVREGYSRIPVYKESIDHITGVLLYKDLIKHHYTELDDNHEQLKNLTIRSLVSPIIFAPENKKIKDLFNEIRSQKIHVAIVVNEYGCTEGLVTIEDILEELVGSEIHDEHDDDEEIPYIETQDKSWIVDAKMSIVDAERDFEIQFPHNPNYETLAGFISWKLGMIPGPGTTIHQDTYSIKILESDKRQIYKVKISPEATLHSSGIENTLES